MERVHLECTQGNHYKFWSGQIETQNDVKLITRWGRIGTFGQSKIYPFSTIAQAKDKLATMVREKLNKGYRQIIPATAVPSPTPEPVLPDGTLQAVKLLVELAIINWSSPTFVFELLKDARQLAPELDWTVSSIVDLEQLKKRLTS